MDANRLKSIPLFAALSDADRAQVARWTDEVDVDAGRHLVNEGEFAYEFFVIEEGTAEVTRGGEKIRELGPGDFFGEIALVETERRTASVTATSPMKVIVMHSRDFSEMESEMPHVARSVTEAIGRRPGR